MTNELNYKIKSLESNELFKSKLELLNENQKNLAHFLLFRFDMKYPLSVFEKDSTEFKTFENIKYNIENYFIGRNILINAITDYFYDISE
jgi:hypothetical protein